MGNQALTKVFKKNIKDGSTKFVPQISSQALLVDNFKIQEQLSKYISEALQYDEDALTQEFIGKFIKNKQKNSEIDGSVNAFLAQKMLSEINAQYMCGFKTSESNIEDLAQSNLSKYFTVPQDENDKQEFWQNQLHKAITLYGLYLLRQKSSSQKSKTFYEYVEDFLASDKNDTLQSKDKQDAGVSSGIGFILIILQELKDIKEGQILIKTLGHLVQTFKRVTPGTFSSNDKQSFVLDATLNDFRSFLLGLISEESNDQQVQILSVQLIFWMGLARSSLEDFLILSQILLLEKFTKIDLRQELQVLLDYQLSSFQTNMKEENFEAGEPRQMSSLKIEMPLTYKSDDGFPGLDFDQDVLITDGKYFYALLNGKGLVKFTTGQDQIPGRVVLSNPDLDKPKSSLMIYNQKIYFRHEEIKPAPFVLIDPETLKEIKSELIFDEKEEKTIQWKENNPQTGRSLESTPMITDGNLVYVIARYTPTKEQIQENESEAQPKLVVEAYDPENGFKFVSEVTLYKNQHLEKFYKRTDMDLWLRRTQWAINGSILACFTQDQQTRFFSMKTGIKLQKKRYFFSEQEYVSYNIQNNQFFVLKQKEQWYQYAEFQIPGFKKKEINSEGNNSEIKLKQFQEKLLQKSESEEKSQQKLNVIDQLIRGLKLSEAQTNSKLGPISESIPKLWTPRLQRSLILNFLSKQTMKFSSEIKRLKDDLNSNSMMQIFRFPFVSYLTSTTFTEFTKGMQESLRILESEQKEETYEVELQSIEDFLKVLNANFEALGFCSLDLSSLFVEKAHYEEFMKFFQQLVDKLVSQQDNAGEEFKQIKQNLKKLCKEIHERSITLIIKEPEQVLANLKDQISQGKIDICVGQIKYLTSEQKLKNLLQGKFNQSIRDDLIAIFKEIAKYDNLALQQSLNQLNFEKISDFKFEPQSQSSQIHQDFIVNFGLEIHSIQGSVADYLAKRLKSSKLSAAAIEAKNDMKKHSSTLCEIVEICFTELSNSYSDILDYLEKTCESKKEDADWEGAPEKFKIYSETASHLLMRHNSMYQLVKVYVQSLLLSDLTDPKYMKIIFTKSVQLIKTINRFYKLWQQFGEKLGIDKTLKFEKNFQNQLYHNNLQSLFDSLRRFVAWTFGLQAYKFIKIESEEEEEKKSEEQKDVKEEDQASKEQKKKEADRKQALQHVIQSNLLSGGIELNNLSLFTQESQEKLQLYAQIMDDKKILENLTAENKKDTPTDEVALQRIIQKGKDEDTDLTITFLQKILEKKVPRVPYANIGGEDGLRMTRAAFALMIKFGDLLEDFTFMVDQVSMQVQELDDINSPDAIKQIFETIKEQESGEIIIKRWESASRMRQWINEKKLERIQKKEKQAIEKIKKEKASKKKEDEKEKEKDEKQIDSSTEPKEEAKEGELTSEEKQKANDEAYSIMEVDLQEAFKKIIEKANFLIKLSIPQRLKRVDQSKMSQVRLMRLATTYKDAPKPKLDWEGRLKTWKQIQTTQGAIKSQKERESDNQNSGVTQILSLLQSSIWAIKIQERVEQSFTDSCKRTAGLKMIKDLVEGDMPFQHLDDIVSWFCSALRQNKNKVSHYLDETKGQGQYLELQSKKYFFDIIGQLVQRLKSSTDQDEIKFILNSLKWSYTARDHVELSQLQLFKILHKGNNKPDNVLKKAWGRSLDIDCSFPNEQKLSKAVLEMFEHLFLTVTGRLVEPEFGDTLKLQKTSSGTVHTLQKRKSVVDENVSELLLGQSFEIIFREFERYRKIMTAFDGVDWVSYVRQKNQERFEKGSDLIDPISNEDEPLFDEIEAEIEEATTEETKPSEEIDPSQIQESKATEDNKQEEEKKEGQEKKEGEEKKEEEEKKEGEEKNEGEEKEEENNQEDEEIKNLLKSKQEKECKKLKQLYSEAFLLRLLKLVEIFTNIANTSSHPLSMVQRIANPYHLSSLLHLLILASPTVKICVLKIIQNIIKLSIPAEIFEEAVRVLIRDKKTLSHKIINELKTEVQFQSIFLKFLYNLCFNSRQKIWSKTDADSDGSYALTQILTQTLRIISSNEQKSSTWGKEVKDECFKALKNIDTFPLEELDIIICLIAGGEYGGISTGSAAITNKQELVTILGYSQTWLPPQSLIQDDKSKEDLQQILKQLKLSTEFQNSDQMAVCLFYDKEAQQHQEMLLVAPSNLSPIFSLNQSEIEQLAKTSPLMDPKVVKILIDLLKSTNENKKNIQAHTLSLLKQKLSYIIKILNAQIEILGQSYIDFLSSNNLLQDFISFLLKFTENKKESESEQVMPINWIEAKLVNIRKNAIESNQSISIDRDDIKAFILDEKEIIFKSTNSVTQNTKIINSYLTSAVNLHKLKAETSFNCFSSQEQVQSVIESGSAVKCGLVPIRFEDFEKLDDKIMQILCVSEAVLINQPESADINKVFKKLIEMCKKDSELSELKQKGYYNVLETIILFVSDEDYPDLTNLIPQEEKKKEEGKTVFDQLLDNLSEWGGLDRELAILEIDTTDMNDLGKVMEQIKNGRLEKQKQEEKLNEQLQKAKQNNSEGEIKKIEEEEKSKQEKRINLINEKKIQMNINKGVQNIFAKVNQDLIQVKIKSFDEFQTDNLWFEEIEKEIKAKISPAASGEEESSEAKQKSEKQMTKLLWSVVSNFDANNLAIEHLKTLNYLFENQINTCLFNIIKVAHQVVMQNLIESKQTQECFSLFLKGQFSSAVMKRLQSGQKDDYSQFKQKIKQILDYCTGKTEYNNFLQFFVKESIINAGISSVKDIRQKKANDFIQYFSNTSNSQKGLNPYMLILLSSYLIKSNFHDILQQENCISTLISIQLCMVIYFQKNKDLVKKLLKSSLKLVKYSTEHIQSLYNTGELQRIVLIKLINGVTSQVDYAFEESKKFSTQQILFLELHLSITDMSKKALNEYNLHIGNISNESEAICQIRKQKQVLREQGSFDLVKYLHHLSQVDEDLKNSLSVQIKQNKPAFQTMNRAFIEIKEVSRVKVKYLESNKFKDFQFLGISNDPSQDIQLKTSQDKEFDWASGSFYVFYPVQTQSLVGFGYPSQGDLGQSYEGQFPVPSLIKPPENVEIKNYRPVSVHGWNEYTLVIDENGSLYQTGHLSGGDCSREQLGKCTDLKKKVINASVGRTCAFVQLEDNSIWYKGEAFDYQLPGNLSKSSFTELKIWENKNEEEKIIDMSSGYQTTTFVTASGKLYIRGKTFLTLIDQVSANQETVLIKLPEGKLCRRAWVSQELNETNFCVFILLEDSLSGQKILYSAGKSEKGCLGQGETVKESKHFQKIEFRQPNTQIQELSSSNQSVLCYDETGELWGWGLNDSNRIGLNDIKENGFWSPQQLFLLNSFNMKPKKIQCGQIHSLVLFQDLEGKEKLFSIGLVQGDHFKQLGVQNEDQAIDFEQPFRELEMFNGRSILCFVTKVKASIVLLQAPPSAYDQLYVHQLPENKSAKGLLHFYKKNDQWNFITEQDYESQKNTLPNLSFAIKCPIQNIQNLKWPELEDLEKELIQEGDQIGQIAEHVGIQCSNTGQEIKGARYYTKCQINEEEIEVNYSEQSVKMDDKLSLHPLIFYRIAKPLKKNAELPKFNLGLYYNQDSSHQLNLEIIPDLSFQKNSQLINLSQDKWKEVCENDEKFDKKYEKELLQKIDSKLQSIIENKSVLEVKPDEDLKINDLDLQDKGLLKLNEKIKKQKVSLIMQYNWMAYYLKSLRISALRGMKDSIHQLFQEGKQNFLSSIKNKIINNEISNLPEGSRQNIRIRRSKAQKFKEEGKCDHNGTVTIFGQIFQQIKKNQGLKDSFRMNTTDSQMFSVEFVGEGSTDAGGPFRECMTNLAAEIESESLPLFIKTPNNRNDHGNNRDCFMLNPASNSPTHAELFKMLGHFLGFTLRTKHAMNFHFPPFFWKKLLNEEVTLDDFEGVDAFSCQILKDIKQNGETLSDDYFNAAIDETFQTFLSNGVQVEICPNGKDKAVNKENHQEFIELVKNIRLNETEKQMNWVKEGVNFVINLDVMNLLSWEDIELRACGLKEISVEKLQDITEYRGTEKDSPIIKMFWEMFGNFTQEERSKYLKFVWGRSKIPLDCSQLRYKHTLQYTDYLGAEGFPIAHTCFFTLDLPPYKDIEMMTQRIKYSIENCGDIDADFNARPEGDESGGGEE